MGETTICFPGAKLVIAFTQDNLPLVGETLTTTQLMFESQLLTPRTKRIHTDALRHQHKICESGFSRIDFFWQCNATHRVDPNGVCSQWCSNCVIPPEPRGNGGIASPDD